MPLARPAARLLALLVLATTALAAPVPIGPGATYERLVRPEGPWVIDVIRVARDAERLQLSPTLAQGQVLGRATMVEQLPPATAIARPIAAVNGDFFTMGGPDAGTPVGLHIEEARLIHASQESTAAFLGPGGRVAFGVAYLRATLTRPDGVERTLSGVNQGVPDAGIVLYTSDYAAASRGAGGVAVALRAEGLPLTAVDDLTCTVTATGPGPLPIPPDGVVLEGTGAGGEYLAALSAGDTVRVSVRMPGVPEWCLGAIGGGPVLIQAGAALPTPNPRHPRTAIGYNEREIVLVTVDGRRPGWSVGVDFAELSAILLDLGCTEALNLDGGGSTTCWVRGEVRNRPSDGGPRTVANGLALVLHGPIGPPASLDVSPDTIWALPGARCRLTASAADADWNPTPAGAVRLTGEGVAVVEGEEVTLERPGAGSVVAAAGDLRQAVPVHVLERPSAARAEPSEAVAMPGDALTFHLELHGPEGQALLPPSIRTTEADADAALGKVVPAQDGSAKLTVADSAVTGALTLRELGVSAAARVEVAQPALILDGSTLAGATATVFPTDDGPTGALRAVTEQDGNLCLALDYALGASEATRAAYVRLDRPLGRALGFTVRLRAEGPAPWVRLAYLDGNGSRVTETVAERLEAGATWRTLRVRLPDGVKEPVTLESIYVVETDPALAPAGTLYVDDVTAWVLDPAPRAVGWRCWLAPAAGAERADGHGRRGGYPLIRNVVRILPPDPTLPGRRGGALPSEVSRRSVRQARGRMQVGEHAWLMPGTLAVGTTEVIPADVHEPARRARGGRDWHSGRVDSPCACPISDHRARGAGRTA